jgi:transporter family-2 protein
MELFTLTSAMAIGVLLAVQASANLQLTKAVGTPYGAAALQLGIAATLLGVVAAASGGLQDLSDLSSASWWELLGGLASPIYIVSAILLFPRLGALASVGLFVAGQMLASVVLDLGGFIGLSRQPLTVTIALGVVIVLIGMTIVIRSQRGQPGLRGNSEAMHRRAVQAGWHLLGLFAGAVLPVQGALNASLRRDVDQLFVVGAFSFTVATVAIGLVLGGLIAVRQTPRPTLRVLGHMPWWGWLGGAAAATYVTANFLLIPKIGAATTIALTVTGQQVASAMIDHRGLFRLPMRPLTFSRLSGLSLLTAGTVIVQLA